MITVASLVYGPQIGCKSPMGLYMRPDYCIPDCRAMKLIWRQGQAPLCQLLLCDDGNCQLPLSSMTLVFIDRPLFETLESSGNSSLVSPASDSYTPKTRKFFLVRNDFMWLLILLIFLLICINVMTLTCLCMWVKRRAQYKVQDIWLKNNKPIEVYY